MIKSFIASVICLLFVSSAFAQPARLKLNITNITRSDFSYYVLNAPLKSESYTKKYQVAASGNRTADIGFNFDGPREVRIYIAPDSDTRGINYHFYISPGDDMVFNADFKKKDYGFVVTGKGSNNNQPLLMQLRDVDVEPFYKDSLPNRVLAAINQQKPGNKKIIEEYIARYKPSPLFEKYLRYNLAYGDAEQYFNFKENNKFGIRAAYKRNQQVWQQKQDSLLAAVKVSLTSDITPGKKGLKNIAGTDKASVKTLATKQVEILNNDDALVSQSYISFIRTFLLREKERLWTEEREHPEAFYRQWYKADTAAGKKLFYDDRQNLLKEKIVNHYFTGKTAEFLYVQMFSEAMQESNPQNVALLFERFKVKYPKSKYITLLSPEVELIKKKQEQTINEHMIFAADNGTKLNSLSEVLALTKGKTVLVDMWGTWCGPCREEITKNSAAIKAHFKGKGLDYLYVANYDLDNEKNWKKLIAYFDLQGTHILANDKLNKDIMGSVKGEGYPTYFIIKKDGSYELSKAGYPMDRDKLIAQLEEAMK